MVAAGMMLCFYLITLDDGRTEQLISVPISFCYHCVFCACPRDSFPLSVFVSYLKSFFFVHFYWLTQLTIRIWWKPVPRMLVMCLSNFLWWHFLYEEKKEYCGLLGGLTFYSKHHIYKSEKKSKIYKNVNIFPFLHRACTQICTKRTLFVGYVLFPSAT